MVTKPKLVYIIHGISIGGAELALLSALPSLSAAFNLRVFVLGKSNLELFEKIDAPIREKIFCWNFSTFLFPLYLPLVYLSLVRFNPNIVISSLWRSALPALLYKRWNKDVKYFVMLHSSVFFHKLDRFFTLAGMKQADVVFADSFAAKQFVERFAAGGKDIRVLSYLTTPTLLPIPVKRFDRKFSFFFLGSLNVVKRVPLAVQIIAWLKDRGVDASLHIYGRAGNDELAIRNAIAESKLSESVIVCGEVLPHEKSAIYDRHNCYIQLSESEGMAMSVAEAMQQGMLCVVTPVGEIAHYADDNVSAIFMEVEKGGMVAESSLFSLLKVLKDEERCRTISSAAHRRFKGAPVFADSLIEAIQKS